MRTSFFLLALTVATVLAGDPMAIGEVAPASTIRVAANICGNTGCYAPQVQRIQHRKFQTLGRPPGQPLGQPALPIVRG